MQSRAFSVAPFIALSWLLAINICQAGDLKLISAYAREQQPSVEFLSAGELKTKLNKNEPVTVIDVRGTDGYTDSRQKIRGAIHIKLRRLKFRLNFAPLNTIGHDSEVVVYCACPNDELSIKAAQLLLESGFSRVRALKGGWQEWLKLKGPVESISKGL